MVIACFSNGMKNLESILSFREVWSQLPSAHRIVSHTSPFQPAPMKRINGTRRHQARGFHCPLSTQNISRSRENDAPRAGTPIKLLDRLSNICAKNIRYTSDRPQGRSNQCCFWMRKERNFIIIPSRIHFGEVERERQKFCVHGIIGARQTGASNEHEHQTQFS